MKTKLHAGILLFLLTLATVQAQWSPATSGTTRDLHGVKLLDSGVGLAVGDSGTILKTTDFGATWTPLNSGTTRALYAVSLSNDGEAVAVGDNGLILRTTDGGVTWVSITSGVRDEQGHTEAEATAAVSLLLGDVNGDGVVDDTDVQRIESAVGQTTDSSNFREDIDVNGYIDRNDVRSAKTALCSFLAP